mgnify:CR=1 FL=1
MFQSSLSLSEGRYIHGGDQAVQTPCFNPRPPFRKGATQEGTRYTINYKVSILALPFGRALQDGVRKS